MCGKDVSEEWLRIKATAKRLRDELVVELEKVGVELAARAGERVQVVKIEVRSDGDGDTGDKSVQSSRKVDCSSGGCKARDCVEGLRVAAQCRREGIPIRI
jgi:hypothetical protein